MILYFAAPVFTSAQLAWNELLANSLRSKHQVILPQEFECKLHLISDYCLKGVRKCDVILVNCDGSDVESGTSAEFGYAKALDKYSIAYRTDIRKGGDCDQGINMMVAHQCDYYVNQPRASYSEIARAILGILERWQ